MRHLAKVAKSGSSTGMTTRNVAIVWAPNLLRCAELEVGGVAALQGVGVQVGPDNFHTWKQMLCFNYHIFISGLNIIKTKNKKGLLLSHGRNTKLTFVFVL